MIQQYRDLGWATIRVKPLGKAPIGQWQNRTDEPESFQRGENVGVRLGAPSGGLVDLDLDCDEAVKLAPFFLPPTATFGRASKPRSHWIYQCKTPTKKPSRTHVELRSTGGQTVFPPSIHETGEPISWTDATAIASPREDDLLKAFGRLCAASVLARVWPELRGDKHHTVLALAGALHRDDWSLEDAVDLLIPAMELDGSSEPHREQAIRDTWENHDRERYGWPTVDQLLGPLDAKAFKRGVELVREAKPEQPGAAVRPLTDLGNAELMIDYHGDELRFVPGMGWVEWHGSLWTPIEAPVDRMGQTVRDLQRVGVDTGQTTIQKWGLSSESSGRIRSALALAKDKPEVQSPVTDFDADPWLLCAPNGIVDLRTGALLEHDVSHKITKSAGVDYDPRATAPRFSQFLAEVFCGDQDLARFVLRYLGYSLTGMIGEQVFQLWVGGGSNGKSVLVDTIRYVLGDYAQTLSSDLLTARRQVRASEVASPDVARLRGCRFAAGIEVEEGQRWNEPLLKQLTGGDRILARNLYQSPMEFDPTWKIVLAVNHKPAVRGVDNGIWRRVHIVPFEATFDGAKQDRSLIHKLKAEGPGILNMLVVACREWQSTGLQPPKRVLQERETYRASQDVVGQFLEECVEQVANQTASRSKLYQVYRKWCADGGEFMLGKHTFNNRMRERGWLEQKAKGEWFWSGMRLKYEATFGAAR